MIKGKQRGGVVASTSGGKQHRKSILYLLPEGKTNRVRAVGMFRNEFKEDFFIEDPVDNSVYKIPKCPNPERNYAIDSEWPDKFVVPISSMVKIEKLDVSTEEDTEPVREYEEEYRELEDLPMSQMTLRQYACIKLGVQDSGIDWLDDLISKSPLI